MKDTRSSKVSSFFILCNCIVLYFCFSVYVCVRSASCFMNSFSVCWLIISYDVAVDTQKLESIAKLGVGAKLDPLDRSKLWTQCKACLGPPN